MKFRELLAERKLAVSVYILELSVEESCQLSAPLRRAFKVNLATLGIFLNLTFFELMDNLRPR